MYQAGWSKQQLAIVAQGYAMHGYGQPGHRAFGTRAPLHARCFYIADGDAAPLIYCCLDLGYITHAMRAGVVERLHAHLGEGWDEQRLVLTCTHTHSGPGGCSQDGLYNLVTPGYVPAHVEAIVEACVSAILDARDRAAPTELALISAPLDEETPVAWNRSLAAYNRNPDVTPRSDDQTHLALDRTMHVLRFQRDGQTRALLSLFGVHATCLGSHNHNHDGDNKGYAALHAEQVLAEQGGDQGIDPPVAIFAQGTAGDVSPHYQGPGAHRRRRQLKGEAEYDYARQNGQRQSEHALAMVNSDQALPISGPLDGVLTYVDMGNQLASPQYADQCDNARTSPPCHGVAFFAGAPIDGPGMPAPMVFIAKQLARRVKRRRLKQGEPEFARLYASQGVKDILMEAGSKRVLGYPLDRIPLPGFADPLVAELKRQVSIGALAQSAMVPSVLPLQILQLGNLRLVCAPGEFTTVAGRRLVQAVSAQWPAQADNARTLISTYCNDYMGYVTTRQEYQEQAYEGGHTVFGQWTLAAFQTCFARLAGALEQPPQARDHDTSTRPPATPAAELALRSNLPPRP
ncbi:hypothetical protein A11A3_15087 [Alcanivorax hongdengensis A-11-3]|uniref:Neutral ceramidase n=1 Tax=Alcanivorax hongdengensis A-11-3 TaxID=1177179 RepID=L0W8T4_9GAMM|nr:neutral/alkaline non-lysosomal ceramidase N-terminal domain-containing protein [Alcanivorax hongdengensis]EKF73138.1 hypothetical protein A11A3_15087 [Alcanivorax hongdengensis A-11-3]